MAVLGLPYSRNAGTVSLYLYGPQRQVRTVSKLEDFADALEQRNADFGRIRGIAHAAKHLKLRKVRPVPNAPSHAANTAIQTDFVGADACGRFAGGYDWLETGSSQGSMEEAPE